MVNEASVREHIERLRGYAAGLAELVDEAFPPGVPIHPGTPFYSGDFPLKTIAGQLDNLLGTFDGLQVALGSKPRQCRHYAFLNGKCQG